MSGKYRLAPFAILIHMMVLSICTVSTVELMVSHVGVYLLFFRHILAHLYQRSLVHIPN